MSQLPAPPRNFILTGFMGTGKSTVGRLLAARLGWPFVDTDTRIEALAGQSIPAIFANQGEPAFRRLERTVIQTLAAASGHVIATGGGTLLDADNRAALLDNGLVVCLDADPERLAARLAAAQDRPLLHGADPAARIRALLAERAPLYAALPHHVETTHLSPEAVVEEILALWHTQSR